MSLSIIVSVVLESRGAAAEDLARMEEEDVGEFVSDNDRELGVGTHEANHKAAGCRTLHLTNKQLRPLRHQLKMIRSLQRLRK